MPRTLQGPYLITESPGLTKCYKCGQPVLAAVVGGLERKIDPAALNEIGELVVLLSGRKTFELRRDLLVRRTADKIRAGRSSGAPVMAEHACKPIPEKHVDHECMDTATALIIEAVGGVIVTSNKSSNDPPF